MILDSTMSKQQRLGAEKLEQLVQAAAFRGQWLVLADEDSALLRKLEEAWEDEAAMIPLDWRAPECQQQFLAALMSERPSGSSPLRLVLAGSSRSVEPLLPDNPGLAQETSESAASDEHYQRWVAGASRMQMRLQQSKRKFAGAVQVFLEQLQVISDPAAWEGRLQAVFYHAEAGMFLEYDWEQWQFRPMN